MRWECSLDILLSVEQKAEHYTEKLLNTLSGRILLKVLLQFQGTEMCQ